MNRFSGPRQLHMTRLLTFAAVALLGAMQLPAAEPDKNAPGKPAAVAVQVEPPGSRLLDITATTSRKRPSAGADLDVLLHVRNVSQTTLFLDKKTSTLVYPSELTSGGRNGRNFTFFDGQSKGQFYALQPNDETILFASTEDNTRNWWDQTVNAFSRFLSFTPSDFQLAAVVYYSSNPDDGDWHIMTKDVTLPVGAPQWVVLLGAGLGGLCAYLLFLRTRPALEMRTARQTLGQTGGALASGLFAVVATILLSRISETQFFLRVTIEDLWGALAVGFVCSYMGRGLLDRLMGAPANVRSGTQQILPIKTANTDDALDSTLTSTRETPLQWASKSNGTIFDAEKVS